MKKILISVFAIITIAGFSSFVTRKSLVPINKIVYIYGMAANGQLGIDSLTIPQEVASNSPIIGTATGSFTGSLLAGSTATQNVTFGFNASQTAFPNSNWFGTINYNGTGALAGGYNVSITNKTTTGCTISIKNNTLATITISSISFDVVGIFNR